MQRVPSSGEEGKLVPLSGKEPKRGKKEIRLTDKSCLRCRLRKVRVRGSALFRTRELREVAGAV